ncbi:hypothetical protein SBA2_350025 [Acidobacteriia bacterium SbA2]|nr:hypothetical protein SBA2_350025 [Acidobacteriia bacterium SbA2]
MASSKGPLGGYLSVLGAWGDRRDRRLVLRFVVTLELISASLHCTGVVPFLTSPSAGNTVSI